ncbi:MAG: hypothetical protein JNM99_02455 [Verrucomicrobiaceae bacterium]|nr:hypothetical protein [Verrucomicrobiaceae bacterium]
MNRRSFLSSSAQTALIAATASGATERSRKAPFRLLYSNDTTNIMSCISPFHAKGAPFRKEMLEATVDEVAGKGVDAHLLQPGLGVVPMWPSKVLPLDEHYAWIKERYKQKPDSFGQFVLDGGDVVKVFIDRCRLRQQAAFISVRMNDAHHKEFVDPKPGDKPGSSIGMSVTRWYAEHPEHRIKPGSLRGADLVLNWAVPEVRAQKLSLIRELCENYDIDGLELDFLRFYSFFRLDETTREQRCAVITAFVREVRDLVDRTQREGRRRWLCARVPAYLPALDVLGLDLRALVAAGLDMVNASAHYYTTQQQHLAAIRKQCEGAALYFELCHSTWNGAKLRAGYDEAPFRRATPEQLHTTAHLAYARGADGMSLFNFAYYREHGGAGRGPFAEPPFDALKGLRDPAGLAQQPQHWFIAPGWRAPGAKPTQVPREIDTMKPAKFVFDLAPPKNGWQRDGRLRIQLQAVQGFSHWWATWNGTALAPTDDVSEPFANPYPPMLGTAETLVAWTVPVSLLRAGVHHLEITLESGDANVINYVDLGIA